MRVLAAMAALAFTVAPGTEPHAVTLRIDALNAGQSTTVDLKASHPGLRSGASNGAPESQVSITTPSSVTVDASVEGLMLEAKNGVSIRVSFEQGGSAREQALKISGSRIMLRRNMDGDLVLGTRSMAAPNRP